MKTRKIKLGKQTIASNIIGGCPSLSICKVISSIHVAKKEKTCVKKIYQGCFPFSFLGLGGKGKSKYIK